MKMVVRRERIDAGQIKRSVKNIHVCPLCKERIEIGIEMDTLKKVTEAKYFPYPHVHLHGNPLHAMLVYIDADMKIRTVGSIKSIEVSRDSETFSQLMKKWSNVY